MSAAIQRVTGEIPACIVLLLLWSCSLQAQMLTGEYYLTEATFEGTRITGLSATFQFTSASDYAATFATSSYNGSAKSQFRLSAGKDTLVDQLPKDISLTGGRSSTINGKLLYQIMLTTSQEVWDKGGQTALGYGWPAGATASKVLITIGTDSTLLLKSLDGKTVLTYAHSGKLFAHNIVTFQVDMRIQQKLARFAPNQGDIVLVRGNFNDWKGNAAAMTATATPGIFAYKHDFSADWIGRALQYNFIIHKTDGQESVETCAPHEATVNAMGQVLSPVYFDWQANVEPFTRTEVAHSLIPEKGPAIAYNDALDQYLVVWESGASSSADLWGRVLQSNGTPVANPFLICNASGRQASADVIYCTAADQFFVVWQDNRKGDYDIRGALLDSKGKKQSLPGAAADSSLDICVQDSTQTMPALAYNHLQKSALAVWQDARNTKIGSTGKPENLDVYGRIVRFDKKSAVLDSTEVPVSISRYYDDKVPDVAYQGMRVLDSTEVHGYVGKAAADGTPVDEWVVVFERSEPMMYTISRIYGVRVRGSDGALLNTWGQVVKPAAALSKAGTTAAGGPPWFPEFPIGWDNVSLWGMLSIYQGSPHIACNDPNSTQASQTSASGVYAYPQPECLVVWTDFRNHGDILGQRLVYYSNGTAYKKGLKNDMGTNEKFTLVLVDAAGQYPAIPANWITWPNLPVTDNGYYQTYNDLSYNRRYGVYLVAWIDWRLSSWDGVYKSYPWMPPYGDLFGQRLWLDPGDSSLVWLDQESNRTTSSENSAIAIGPMDEGNMNYPALAFSMQQNDYMIAFQYSDTTGDADVQAVRFKAAPPIRNTSVQERPDLAVPDRFILHQNSPNPFNPATDIAIELRHRSRVKLAVYNLLGQEIAVLCDMPLAAGLHRMQWDGRDLKGVPAPSGVYLYRMDTESGVAVRKMLLVK